MSTSKVHLGFLGRLRYKAVGQILQVREILRYFSFWVVVLPAMAIASTMGNVYYSLWPVGPLSQFQTFGATIAAASFVTAATCWVLRGDFFHRWLIYLTLYLWCRAANLAGTEMGTTIAVSILIWYALIKYEAMRPYLQSRLLVSLLLGSLLCHCLPMLLTLDFSVWLTHIGIWPYRVNIAMMLVGRMLLWSAIIASEVIGRTSEIATKRSLSAEETGLFPLPPVQTGVEPARPTSRKAA